jgi:hypothetical protein
MIVLHYMKSSVIYASSSVSKFLHAYVVLVSSIVLLFRYHDDACWNYCCS